MDYNQTESKSILENKKVTIGAIIVAVIATVVATVFGIKLHKARKAVTGPAQQQTQQTQP